MSQYYNDSIFELSRRGRPMFSVLESGKTPDKYLPRLPAGFQRAQPPALPHVTQVDVVRHYTNLSTKNVGIDTCFYPLGSCTMKHNPRVNEYVAALPGNARVHPLTPEDAMQGILRMYHEIERDLCEVSGMDGATLQPAAGAHGELTALMVIRAYFRAKGETHRTEVLIPDSAHGTNPASCTLCGYTVVPVASGKDGLVDMEDFKKKLGPNVAAMMLTNPNTVGIYETHIADIAAMLHDRGAQLYMDGANFNAIMGYTRPGDFGVDVQHFNLHKTFSTPHGGGGPGLGPIGVKKHLEPFLPGPRVVKQGETYGTLTPPRSIGRVRQFLGNTGTVARALTYIRALGGPGLKQVSEHAVLNANYLFTLLKKKYKVPYDRLCMHEFVLEATLQENQGVHATDIAKALLDYGVHPMTIYFPLIVHECLMIEPTETESKATLDAFAKAMNDIADRCATDKETLVTAPHTKPVTRLDELRAARQPVLTWQPPQPTGV